MKPHSYKWRYERSYSLKQTVDITCFGKTKHYKMGFDKHLRLWVNAQQPAITSFSYNDLVALEIGDRLLLHSREYYMQSRRFSRFDLFDLSRFLADKFEISHINSSYLVCEIHGEFNEYAIAQSVQEAYKMICDGVKKNSAPSTGLRTVLSFKSIVKDIDRGIIENLSST